MSTSIATFRKDPDEVLDYTIDWGTNYLETGDTITGTPVWTIPSGITKDSQSNTTTTSTAWLSGGTADTSYEIACKIVTTNGRTAERTFTVLVEER